MKKGIQDSILTATLTCPAIPDSSATSVSAEGISDFDQVFFPFALPSHATCAPTNLFSWDKAAVQHLERTIGNLGKPVVVATAPLAETLYAPPVNNPTNLSIISVRTLVSQIADSASRSSDPTGSSTNELCNPLALLRRVPLKYIYFHHDIRPPYLGTHTKFRTQAEAAKLTRNPLKRVRVELEYDYDSEAEWQEPDEGDEVESNAESEDESTSVADPDEMDDFLDDEGTGDGSKIRRKLFTNDMKPICTGIYWEDPKGQCKVDAEWNHDPRQYRMEIIHGKRADLIIHRTWHNADLFKQTINCQSIHFQRLTGRRRCQKLPQRLNSGLNDFLCKLGQTGLPACFPSFSARSQLLIKNLPRNPRRPKLA